MNNHDTDTSSTAGDSKGRGEQGRPKGRGKAMNRTVVSAKLRLRNGGRQAAGARRLGIVLIAICAVIGSQIAWGAPQTILHAIFAPTSSVWCVDDDGGSTGGTPCTNATAFTSIQTAINGAASGD